MRRVAADVVLVHEWLTTLGGSELVLREFAELYPEAPIVVGVADPAFVRGFLPGRRVIPLLDPRLPWVTSHWALYAPLMLWRWRRVRIEARLVLVSSHFGAHQVAPRVAGSTVVYYHTPMRIAWRFDLESGRLPRAMRGIARVLLPLVRRFDRSPAPGVDQAVANSEEIRDRLRHAYGIEARVINPPIDTSGAPTLVDPTGSPPFYLCFGRLVAYKRIELAIEACRLLGRRMVIAGDGPERARLELVSAGADVEFVGRVDDERKWALLSQATALLFPGEEDFGIVPVEALAVGTPVVALARGGACESVQADCGVLFDDPTPVSMARAMVACEERHFDSELLVAHATRFGVDRFRQQMIDAVGDLWEAQA